MINTLLGDRFLVEEQIARSDNGEVYRATDNESQAIVAVKVLRPTSKDSNELLQRRLQEFRLLRRLNHPNVVQVLQTGLTEDNLFFVAMEFLTGETLADVLDEVGVLPPELVAEYLDQVASVLDMLHQNNIIHRDLKPKNLMVQRDADGNEVIKVLGFVFAKIQSTDPKQQQQVTQAGVAIGTPAFMSPEQAMGRRVTKSSDIYSLGVTLFYMLTGRLPFKEKNDLYTMLAHVKTPIPRFSAKNPNNMVPGSVEAVVHKAMAKELGQRYRSAGELARAFREALQNPEEEVDLSQQTAIPGIPLEQRGAKGDNNMAVMIVLLVVGLGCLAAIGYLLLMQQGS